MPEDKDHYYIEETRYYEGRNYVEIICEGELSHCLAFVYTRFNGCYDTETVIRALNKRAVK